jgi:hypothetical protein
MGDYAEITPNYKAPEERYAECVANAEAEALTCNNSHNGITVLVRCQGDI